MAHNLVNDYVLRYNTLNESLKWNLHGLLVEQIMSIMLLTCQGLIFFSFSFLLYHNCLRWTLISLKVIAATVASDPIKYSEAFLGKPNGEYCEWILNPEKWGGVFYFCYSFWWWYQGISSFQSTVRDMWSQSSFVIGWLQFCLLFRCSR